MPRRDWLRGDVIGPQGDRTRPDAVSFSTSTYDQKRRERPAKLRIDRLIRGERLDAAGLCAMRN
jgi:hypothetical protein